MCGIWGFNFEDRELLKAMGSVLEHRGPDDAGFFHDFGIMLGHRRLSIIDLSRRARQPLGNESGNVQVVCNGEVYNFKELREGLEKRGHRFRSDSDNEVIVHAYEEYGMDMLERLRGMYAFALYDGKAQKLFLVRDRLGIKPLYYHFDGKHFLFASEIKSILQYKKFPLDREALDEMFTLQYVLAPKTLFKGIRKMKAGGVLTFDLKKRKMETRVYWTPDLEPEKQGERYFLDGLEKLIKESVRMRLVSDVPLGVYLSGGLDSSYITALAAENVRDLKTFTIGFGHSSDETRYARMVADALGTEHKELMVKEAKMDILPKLTWHMDEPLIDIAAIPLYMIAQSSKKYLTVAMMGDGGDELFGGYDRYKVMAMRVYYRRMPGLFRKPVMVLMKRRMGSEAFTRFQDLVKRDDTGAYLAYISTFSDREKKEMYAEGFLKDVKSNVKGGVRELLKGNQPLMQRVFWMDFRAQLPEDYLMKVDKMTMANSIEVRVPYLDHNVVEFALRIPPGMKVKRLRTKYLFRKLIAKKLPQEIVKRKKSGFVLPTEKWMQGGLREVALQMFEKAPEELLDRDYIKRIVQKYVRDKRYYTRQLWTAFSFTLWYRMYMEGDGAKGIPGHFNLEHYL